MEPSRLTSAGVMCVFLLAWPAARAQPARPDDFGGLASYPVPAGEGGPTELRYCVLYAARAWRMANMIEEGTVTLPQAKAAARSNLGRIAAAEEIQDFERLESHEYVSPSALGAERFERCAERLKLRSQARRKANSEFCFRSLAALDFAARLRADGKPQPEVVEALAERNPNASRKFVDGTVDLAFSGPSIAQGNPLIEDAFASCFARAGERGNLK